jgi:hypothetical protein
MNTLPDHPPHKICFLFGIDYRSGTNHLYQLLRLHPNCIGLEPIWEDFLLHHSKLLETYVASVFNSWNPAWQVDRRVGTQKDLLRELGKTLELFLLRQTSLQSDKSEPLNRSVPPCYVTKTPSVEGLNRFFSLFPNAIPIVLVRDGRSVVESGMRSFGWDFIQQATRWKHRARIILEFQDYLRDSSLPGLVIRFEDLITDEKKTLTNVFHQLAIDPGLYDFQKAQTLKVLGSSDTSISQGTLHWRSTDKPVDFSPIRRFEHWTPEQHRQFNEIAEEELRLFGYP